MSSEFTPASESTLGQSAPPPAQESAPPVEATEAASTEVPAAGEGQAAENEPAAQKAEGESDSQASTEPEETPTVRAQARKVFMEVQKMGGEPAFNAAKSIFDSYFFKSPHEAITELSRYGARFYPVRDVLITQTVKDHPDDVAAMLRELHPDLEVQVGKKGQPQQQASAQPDPVEWARGVTDDPLASDAEKAAARHILATQEQLGKLPGLEQQVTNLSEFQQQTRAERVQAEQGRYVQDLMESVVDKTYRDSGLEGSPVKLATFQELVSTAHLANPEYKARFVQAMKAIEAGDTQTADLLKDQIRRDGEAVAFEYAKQFSAGAAQAITSKTQQLTQERPKVVTGGQTPGPAVTHAPPFDEADYSSALKDIKARG